MRHRRHQGRKQRAARHPAHQVGTRGAGMEAEGEQRRQGGHDGARSAYRQRVGRIQHGGQQCAREAAGEIDRGKPADADHRLQQKAHDQKGNEIADQMVGRTMQGGGGEQAPPFALPQHLDAVGRAHCQKGEMTGRIGAHPVGGGPQFAQKPRHQDGADRQGEPGNTAQQAADKARRRLGFRRISGRSAADSDQGDPGGGAFSKCCGQKTPTAPKRREGRLVWLSAR